MSYNQLTQCQRYQIQALLKSDHNQMEIAETIEVHKSTISRELKRNQGQRGYRPRQAHQKAINRRKRDRRRSQLQTWVWIEERIREDGRPEQISLWKKKFGTNNGTCQVRPGEIFEKQFPLSGWPALNLVMEKFNGLL